MALKSRNTFPPIQNGFQFFQPETGWSSTAHIGFDPTVTEIINHRLANPRFSLPTDRATVEIELENYVSAKLLAIPGGDAYLIGPATTAPPPQVPRRNRAVAAGVEKAQNLVAGIGLWAEFFGDSPVAQPLAERRASICAGCPENTAPETLFAHFTENAAKEIAAIFGALKQRSLHTNFDDKLGYCKACDCPNKSNIFVPLELKLKKIKPEAKAKLHPGCWLLAEEKENRTG
jgi:hypothetical protein